MKRGVRLAAELQGEIDAIGLSRPDASVEFLYDAMITHQRLRKATRSLFRSKHYAQAVEEAYKLLCNRVKERVPGTGRDGADLMQAVFSENKPSLKLNALSTDSDVNEQRGYKFILAGVMAGVRNPRAHEHEYEEHPENALELLVLANHLLKRIDSAST